jgi:hypothetical protein
MSSRVRAIGWWGWRCRRRVRLEMIEDGTLVQESVGYCLPPRVSFDGDAFTGTKASGIGCDGCGAGAVDVDWCRQLEHIKLVDLSPVTDRPL